MSWATLSMARTRHKSPSASESPLFVPETSPPPPYRSPSAPDLVALVEFRSASIAPTELAPVDVPALIQELSEAAVQASLQLNNLDSGSDALVSGLPLVPSKRKGICSNHKLCKFTNCHQLLTATTTVMKTVMRMMQTRSCLMIHQNSSDLICRSFMADLD